MFRCLPLLPCLLAVIPAGQGAVAAPSAAAVSAQGYVETATAGLGRTSPGGRFSMRILPLQVGFDQLRADLEVTGPDGVPHRIPGVQGNGFFVSDLGRVVVLETAEVASLPSDLRIYDLDGHLLRTEALSAPRTPVLSPDGRFLACGVRGGTTVLDLRTLSSVRRPRLDLFAVGPDGALAGVSYRDGDALVVQGASGDARRLPMRFRARAVTFSTAGSEVFVLGPQSLLALSLAGSKAGETAAAAFRVLYSAAPGEELQDVRSSAGDLLLGLRRATETTCRGELVRLSEEGGVLGREAGPVETLSHRPGSSGTRDAIIPWPILPNSQHPVGNTYGEYQNYGGAPYPHPGFDCMGSPYQPVFAVRGGVVKAILTTSAQYHWRVAVGDSVTPGTSRGYLYAHLNQSSITVHVGDIITAGQQLGTLVEWPGYNFTHCHFTRIEDSGTTWDGAWLSVHNPQLDLNHSETTAPVFQPARGTDLLAFCANQTSSYQGPGALHGAVDIIAHVSDQISSTWKCTVQELRYTIYPQGNIGSPLVDNKLALFCDFTCDTYGSGTVDAFMINLLYKQDSVCRTQGDYDYREFYHILTNSDGDQVYGPEDMNEAWDTSSLPDGNYVIRVTAIDVAGNAATDSMTVTTANGNPSGAPGAISDASSFIACLPNPMAGAGTVRFALPDASPARISIYGPGGRLVRRLFEGALPSGRDSVVWNGRDGQGQRLPAGVYLFRLEGSGIRRTCRVVLVD